MDLSRLDGDRNLSLMNRFRLSVSPLAALALGLAATGCNSLAGSDDIELGSAAEASEDAIKAIAPLAPLNCVYEPADVGVSDGQQLATSLEWQGYAPGSDEVTTVHAMDFYDCNGSKNVDVVVFEMAKFNCGACEQDAATLESRLAAWRAKGYDVEWVTTLVTGVNGSGPASPDAAKVWRDQHAFTTVNVVADTSYQLLPPGKNSFGTPSFVIVDPRTQTVVKWQEGLVTGPGGHDSIIESLAAKNSGAL